MVDNSFKEKAVLLTSSEGASEFLKEGGIKGLTDIQKDHLLEVLLTVRKETRNFTPPARWAHNNEPDPHGSHYSSETREKLCMGNLTDDELANAVFLLGDDREHLFGGIGVLTAGKERIRWLSRRVTLLENTIIELKK